MQHSFAKAFSVTVFMLVTSATHAEAHSSLVSASPTANSTVQAPSMIELHFNETLEPRFSGFTVMKDGWLWWSAISPWRKT